MKNAINNLQYINIQSYTRRQTPTQSTHTHTKQFVNK